MLMLEFCTLFLSRIYGETLAKIAPSSDCKSTFFLEQFSLDFWQTFCVFYWLGHLFWQIPWHSLGWTHVTCFTCFMISQFGSSLLPPSDTKGRLQLKANLKCLNLVQCLFLHFRWFWHSVCKLCIVYCISTVVYTTMLEFLNVGIRATRSWPLFWISKKHFKDKHYVQKLLMVWISHLSLGTLGDEPVDYKIDLSWC